MKKVLTYLLCLSVLTALSLSFGCKTAGVYDPGKTAAVENLVQPVISEVVTLTIDNNQPIKAQLGDYYRAFGGVFKSMAVNTNFSVTYLVEQADAATASLQAKLPPNKQSLVSLGKGAVLLLYQELIAPKGEVPLNPERAPAHVALVIWKGIDAALVAEGLPGI